LEMMFCVPESQSSMSLSHNNKTSSKHDNVKRALRLLWQMGREDRRRLVRKPRMAAAGRWIRLQSLQSMLNFQSTQITKRQTQILPIMFARLSTERKNEYVRCIRLLEQRGQIIRLSDRLDLLSRLVRTQSALPIPKVKLELPSNPEIPGTVGSQPDTIPKARTVKTPMANGKSPHLLLPIFPVSKPELQAAAA